MPPLPRPSTSRHLARETLRFDRSQVSYSLAVRDAVGVAAPLALGVWFGQPALGLTAAVGALNVGFSDGHDPYRARLVRMLVASLLSALSVFAGATLGHHDALAVLVTMVWAFAGGMLVVLGPTASQVGTTTMVLVLIYGAEPMPVGRAAGAAALVCLGGLWQAVLSSGAWPARGRAPERHAMADAWRALAAWAGSAPEQQDAPPATTATTAAGDVLTTLRADRGPTVEALLSLYNQLERARPALVSLAEQRRRLLASEGAEAASAVDAVFRALAQAFSSVAALLDADMPSPREVGAPASGVPGGDALEDAVRALARVVADAGVPGDAGRVALSNARALAGQVRAAAELAPLVGTGGPWEALASWTSVTVKKDTKATSGERPPMSPLLVLRGRTLRPLLLANLSPRSTAFRHALRLALCVGLGDTLARAAGWPHGYWLPMTVAIVLRPDFTTTMTRGFARVIGTLLGLGVASLLVFVTPSPAALVVLAALCVLLMRGEGRANYLLLAACVSAFIVVLFALLGAPPLATIEARGLATLGGGALALVVYALWPTWEHTQAPVALAELLDAYRGYFVALTAMLLHPERRDDALLAHTRRAARLARTNAEASLARWSTEPRRFEPGRRSLDEPHAALDRATRLLASARRFVRYTMVLEAGLAQAEPVPEATSIDAFARDVETTLRALAERLRGQPANLDALPDLRAEQLALRERCGDDPRLAPVATETDRITNATNTMTALVRELSAPS